MAAPHHWPDGWHSRGYLPHRSRSGLAQFLTFRLGDALPRECVARLDRELQHLYLDEIAQERRLEIERHLDRGYGSCVLGRADVATLVRGALHFFEGERYALHAWVIMPNHVHALITPRASVSVLAIVHSWKSFTAKKIGSLMAIDGAIWQPDYFDRFVRNPNHQQEIARYIEQNPVPVSAGLVGRADAWPFSSATKG